jgi:hypothetical protein
MAASCSSLFILMRSAACSLLSFARSAAFSWRSKNDFLRASAAAICSGVRMGGVCQTLKEALVVISHVSQASQPKQKKDNKNIARIMYNAPSDPSRHCCNFVDTGIQHVHHSSSFIIIQHHSSSFSIIQHHSFTLGRGPPRFGLATVAARGTLT